LRPPAILRDGEIDVWLVRIAPRVLDDDNLRGALKGVRDAVADWLGRNDNDQHIHWRYAQLRGSKGEYAVTIACGPHTA